MLGSSFLNASFGCCIFSSDNTFAAELLRPVIWNHPPTPSIRRDLGVQPTRSAI